MSNSDCTKNWEHGPVQIQKKNIYIGFLFENPCLHLSNQITDISYSFQVVRDQRGHTLKNQLFSSPDPFAITCRLSPSSLTISSNIFSDTTEWICMKLKMVVPQSILHKMTVWIFDLLKNMAIITKNRTQDLDSRFFHIFPNSQV